MTGHVARWTKVAAHAVPLVILPSGLWRFGVMLSIPGFGNADARAQSVGVDLYMVTLTVVSEALGLLTLGLVKPWGEVVPRWIPLIDGRPVRPMTAVVPAALGALVLTLGVSIFGLRDLRLPGHTATETAVLLICYPPLAAWGPLLGVVTYAYYRRRSQSSKVGPAMAAPGPGSRPPSSNT